MKALFIILVLSLGAILAAVGALWWRLRGHLQRPGDSLKKDNPPANAPAEVQPEHESIEKT